MNPIFEETPSKYLPGGRRGSFGIEIEVEGRFLPPPPKGWVEHVEPSLRGESKEYVLAQPCNFDAAKRHLDALEQTLSTAYDGRLPDIRENAPRASTHIHYNVGKIPFWAIFGIVEIYTILEPLLFRICGPNRDGNLFCMSSYDTGDLPDFMACLAEGIKYVSFGGGMERGKYAGLNLDPIFRLGSIEFRLFPSTTQAHQITEWMLWIQAMADLAQNEADRTFETLLGYAMKHPLAFAERVIPDIRKYSHLVQPHSLAELVTFGCQTAHEIIRKIHPILLSETYQAPPTRSSPAWEEDEFLEIGVEEAEEVDEELRREEEE